MTTEERFWSKVDRSGGPDACWEWQAGCFPYGYGSFWMDGKSHGAHKVSYELSIGQVPAGLLVCHHCDNPPCCNPEHLFLGTVSDNAADMVSKMRQPYGSRNGAYTKPEMVRKGSSHGCAILTESDIPKIRARRDSGEMLSTIASDYGVSICTISLIHKRRIWRHV